MPQPSVLKTKFALVGYGDLLWHMSHPYLQDILNNQLEVESRFEGGGSGGFDIVDSREGNVAELWELEFN